MSNFIDGLLFTPHTTIKIVSQFKSNSVNIMGGHQRYPPPPTSIITVLSASHNNLAIPFMSNFSPHLIQFLVGALAASFWHILRGEIYG